LRTTFGASRPFVFKRFLDRAIAGLLPVWERFFIAFTRTLSAAIVAGKDSTGHGGTAALARKGLSRQGVAPETTTLSALRRSGQMTLHLTEFQ
jgi:hypothetical protein